MCDVRICVCMYVSVVIVCNCTNSSCIYLFHSIHVLLHAMKVKTERMGHQRLPQLPVGSALRIKPFMTVMAVIFLASASSLNRLGWHLIGDSLGLPRSVFEAPRHQSLVPQPCQHQAIRLQQSSLQ